MLTVYLKCFNEVCEYIKKARKCQIQNEYLPLVTNLTFPNMCNETTGVLSVCSVDLFEIETKKDHSNNTFELAVFDLKYLHMFVA